MRLLIVEDDAPLASGLQRILEAEGHAVDVTPRGEEAVLAAAQEKFDLVILDIGLPQMDGFEVLRRLRATAPTRPGRCRCWCSPRATRSTTACAAWTWAPTTTW
jgi:DNA-binding response OmpR family regulator